MDIDRILRDYHSFLVGLGAIDARTFEELCYKQSLVAEKPNHGVVHSQKGVLKALRSCDDVFIRDHFATYYKMYESWISLLSIQDQLEIMGLMLPFIGNPKRILDVGCGPCVQFIYLLKEGLISSEVDGIDPLVESLREGSAIAQRFGATIAFHEGRIPDLAPAIQMYDCVTCIDTLHWSFSWRRGLVRMAGLLAPDGKLFVVYSPDSARVRIKSDEVVRILRGNGFASVEVSSFDTGASGTRRVVVCASKGG